MRLKFDVLIITFFLLSACSEEKGCINISDLHEKNGIFFLNDKLYEGCVVKVGENNRKFNGHVKNGLLDGEFEVRIGEKLFQHGSYQKGKLNDSLFIYDSIRSSLKIIEIYNERGELDGTCLEYYENNNLKYKKPYSSGLLHGLVLTYHKSGKIAQSMNYEKGVLSGSVLEYFEDGKVKSFIKYQDNHGEGLTYSFFNKDQDSFFWGELEKGKSTGKWYYKLSEDSCFVRTYDSADNYANISCDCSKLPLPPLDSLSAMQ